MSDFKVGDIVRFAKTLWRVEDVGNGNWQSGLILITNDFDTRAVPVTSVKRVRDKK
jgi:hypothetical protein